MTTLSSIIGTQERTGLKWKAWNILCGISGAPTDGEAEDVEEPEAPEQDRKATAFENPKWARIALMNGGILGAVCVFILAYFG